VAGPQRSLDASRCLHSWRALAGRASRATESSRFCGRTSAEERARRSLKRGSLLAAGRPSADDTLVGAKDLRVNLDLLEVDVIEFDDALQSNDLELAVRLYAGPFLDGFFIPRAPECERRAEGERAVLARDYASALEKVANRVTQRGDAAGAVGHWRKWAATDPLNAPRDVADAGACRYGRPERRDPTRAPP
jgi:hypothetical protein